jgi:hemerythrin-like domain-containing protein
MIGKSRLAANSGDTILNMVKNQACRNSGIMSPEYRIHPEGEGGGAMKATEVLREEHKAIKVALSILNHVSSKLESGEEVDQEDLGRILEFIRTFVDTCHHGKEEDLLFVALENADISRARGLIAAVLREHEIGRSYVRNMREAVEKYKTAEHSYLSRFVENAKKYAQLLDTHIGKEDNILYPMADTDLPEETQHELIEKFEELERDRIGIGKHEELHELLHHLRDKYLE